METDMESAAARLLQLAAEISDNGCNLISLASYADDIGQREAAIAILEAGYLVLDGKAPTSLVALIGA